MDEVVRLIEKNTGLTPEGVREQLEELMQAAEEHGRSLADNLDPLEQQLEQLLDELNSTRARALRSRCGNGRCWPWVWHRASVC